MKHLFIVAAVATLALGCSRKDRSADSKEEGGRAVIQNKGSDTLVNVAQAWAEAYKEKDPSVAVAVSGGGSGTGISALLNGTVDLANSSRQIKDKEVAMAKKKGIEPKEHVVGYDALAVFVHNDNPMKEVSLKQLADLYGEGGTIDKWAQWNLSVPGCGSDEVVRVSRQNNSGTYAYFKKTVLGKGDYRLGSRDMHGSKDVVDLVAKTPCAIGYSGLAYANDELKTVCVSKGEGQPCVMPTVDTAIDQSYPIARPLFMYTNGEPKGATKKYLDWILSDEGQCIIMKKGYAPARTVKCS